MNGGTAWGTPMASRVRRSRRARGIIGLVDYFEALTTDRPYHRAMSPEAAIGLLRQEAGKGLDPTLVDKFIDMLPSLKASAEGTHVGPAGSAAAPAAPPRIVRRERCKHRVR